MLKIEQKIVNWIDMHLLQIVAVILAAIAVYMRKATMYHSPFDMENAFYTDAAGYLHTAFYSLWIQWLTMLPIVSLKTIKILTILFDVVTAVLAALWIRKSYEGKKGDLAAFVCFGLLLVSPLGVANGVVWLHVDCICISLLLCAQPGLEKKHYLVAGLLGGVAAALSAQYIVILLISAVWNCKKRKGAMVSLLVSLGVFLVLNGLACLTLKTSITDGLFSLINWLVIDPGTGAPHANPVTWLCSLLGQFGYLIGVGSMLIAFRTGKYWKTALVLNSVMILYVAGVLQYGYWWSNLM